MNYRFGKNPAKADYRTLRLATYLTDQIPEPPVYSALDRVRQGLCVDDPNALFNMLANDRLGTCTIAGVSHAQTIYHGLLGKRNAMTEGAVVKLYLHLTGGVDSGLYLLDVLNYWRKNAISGSKPLAYAKVNTHDHRQMKEAIYLFGTLYAGMQVQQGCVADFEAGRTWTPGPLTYSGHCICIPAYDEEGLTCVTWGATQRGTWAWGDCCLDEAYALIPPEAKDPMFAPGFDFKRLMAALNEVAS